MSDSLKTLYESVSDRIQIDFDTFSKNLQDWIKIPLYENNRLIGCVIQKDNEGHIGYQFKPTASIKKHLKDTLKKVLETYGFAVTSVMENNEKGLLFCKRLGFYEIAKEGSKIILKCDRCKYAD